MCTIFSTCPPRRLQSGIEGEGLGSLKTNAHITIAQVTMGFSAMREILIQWYMDSEEEKMESK